MATAQANISSSDRLFFTLFLAVAIHAVAIFGVTFAQPAPTPAPKTIEATLAYHKSENAPDDADYIAQINQEGAGDSDEKKELSTTEQPDFADDYIAEVELTTPGLQNPNQYQPQSVVIHTQNTSQQQQTTAEEKQQKTPEAPRSTQDSLSALSQDIASLQARLDSKRQAYAKRPRIHRLTSVSTKAHYEAAYIDAFRRAVEASGTRNFPQRALAEQAFGNVRLMVAIQASGEVSEIKVLNSSGYRFLDEAAVQSVRLAAPFAPFTGELQQKADVLEIIRTWRFDSERILSSH